MSLSSRINTFIASLLIVGLCTCSPGGLKGGGEDGHVGADSMLHDGGVLPDSIEPDMGAKADSSPGDDAGSDASSMDSFGDTTPAADTQLPGDVFELVDGLKITFEPPAAGAPPRAREAIVHNADYLVAQLTASTGLSFSYELASAPQGGPPTIVVRRPTNALAPNPYDSAGPAAFEGFHVSITPNKITIDADDPRGQRYALRWLLLQLAPGQKTLAPRDHADKPHLRLRAVHFGNYRISELRASLDKAAAARLNVIQWETRGRVNLPALGPALHATPISNSDIRDILVEAAKRQIVIVPAIKLLSHQEKLLGAGALSAACPGERVDTCVEQTYPGLLLLGATEYDPTYVTSAGKSILEALILPALDELVALFSHVDPVPAVAVGHDEAKSWRLKAVANSLGGGMTAAQLLADHLLAVHDHLEKQGVRSFAWADLLLDPENPLFAGFDGGGMHGHRDEFADALPLLKAAKPQSLVFGDWHYKGTSTDFPTNDYLATSDIPVAGATWKDETVVLSFTKDEIRLGGLGMVATVWGTPTFWGAGNDRIMAFSGDTFWTGGNPGLAANRWPEEPEMIITDDSGSMVSRAAPGDFINVWVKARDAETPTSALQNFEIHRRKNRKWTAANAVVSYEPAGPGWGLDYSWKLRWQIPADDPQGMKDLALFFTDADGMPSFTTHLDAIFIGATNVSQNLVINPGFETPLDGVGSGWNAGSPSGMTSARSASEFQNGGASFCIEVKTPCVDCVYNTLQTKQTFDISALATRGFELSYFFKSVGRDGDEIAYVDAVVLDAARDYICWPGAVGRICHVKQLASSRSAGKDHDWRPDSALLEVPADAAYLMLRLRRVPGSSTPTGKVCFDDVSLHALSR